MEGVAIKGPINLVITSRLCTRGVLDYSHLLWLKVSKVTHSKLTVY